MTTSASKDVRNLGSIVSSQYGRTVGVVNDLEWGAAELFRATGQERYRNDAKRYTRQAGFRHDEAARENHFPFAGSLLSISHDHAFVPSILSGQGYPRCFGRS
jgi:hypothetical protein